MHGYKPSKKKESVLLYNINIIVRILYVVNIQLKLFSQKDSVNTAVILNNGNLEAILSKDTRNVLALVYTDLVYQNTVALKDMRNERGNDSVITKSVLTAVESGFGLVSDDLSIERLDIVRGNIGRITNGGAISNSSKGCK